MADPRVQQARERAEAWLPISGEYPLNEEAMALDIFYLADRVAALETALRGLQQVMWRFAYPSNYDPLVSGAAVAQWYSLIDAALAGSGTEPAQGTVQESYDRIDGTRVTIRTSGTEPARVLPDDMVCACLHETGSRQVTLWERCERCHAFMRHEGTEPAQEQLVCPCPYEDTEDDGRPVRRWTHKPGCEEHWLVQTPLPAQEQPA